MNAVGKLYLAVLLAVGMGRICEADELPYFSALRSEVTNQLTIASNSVPFDKKLASVLKSNLKLIDRTKTNVISGSAALGTLFKSLARTTLSNAFYPIILETRTDYLDLLQSRADQLSDRLDLAVPGKVRTAAAVKLAKFVAVVEVAETNSVMAMSLKSLAQASKLLAPADKAVTKAESAPLASSVFTATISESNVGTSVYDPVSTRLEATYDAAAGLLKIDSAEFKIIGSGRAQTRTFSINARISGNGLHELDLTEPTDGFAAYGRGVLRGTGGNAVLEFNEVFPTLDSELDDGDSGSLSVTLDQATGVVYGEFSVACDAIFDPTLSVVISGTFVIKLSR